MKLLKNIPFDFENKKYEIRIFFGDNTINIAAFRNNYPANGFRRQIKLTKNSTPEKALDSKMVTDIIDWVKNDIFENRWETFLSAVS
ncbi:hypothetical protein ACFL6P_00705 [Candidatus Latescibacterota bacterium]